MYRSYAGQFRSRCASKDECEQDKMRRCNVIYAYAITGSAVPYFVHLRTARFALHM
jgi:hypothetical protein